MIVPEFIRTHLLIGASVVSWAFAFPLIFLVIEIRQELSPVNLAILRLFIACIAFSLLLVVKRKKITPLQKKDIPGVFVLGFGGIIIYHLGLNYGEQFVSPSVASLIIATIPVFTVIFALIFLHETLTSRKAIGVALSFCGVALIALWGKPDTALQISYIGGLIGVLVAAIVGALYTIAGKKLLTRYSGFSLTAYAMLLGSLGLIPFINTSLFQQVSALSLPSIIAVLFLGVFSTVIAYTFWYIVLEKKTASDLSVYVYSIPILSTIISFFWFGDLITIFFIIGGVLIIAGLRLVNVKKRKRLRVS